MTEVPCPSRAPLLTCKEAETGTETGMTGMESPFSLCSAIVEEKREEPDPPIRVWPDSMPVMPAAEHCTVCGQGLWAPQSQSLGLCGRCVKAGVA